MQYRFLLLAVFVLSCFLAKAQSWKNNGKLDDFSEFTTKYTVPFEMPDGIKLMTDVYVPKLRDSLVLPVDLFGNTLDIQFIPRDKQVIIYDSLNGQPNPNPYQLPTIFTRTPYNKGDAQQTYEVGIIMSILGYNYCYQDMRGRYSSEGIYFPMYSDSWNKNAYHPHYAHVLDPTDLNDPKNSNRHEDGYHSIKCIDKLKIPGYYDPSAYADSADGFRIDTTSPGWDMISNGSIGMFGASALGNTQLQLAAAHRVQDSIPSLKCLMPIVATIEHYISTGYNNGVFRDRIVTGWLKGQIFSGTEDELIPIDDDQQNSIHSSRDYDLPKQLTFSGLTRDYQQNKFDAANISIDHFSAYRYPLFGSNDLGPAGFYPNSVGRADMDASCAFVSPNGEAVDMATQMPLPNLNTSRYTNLQTAIFHVTGWWDIFTEGQINTLNFTRKHVDAPWKNKQKMIIGPWAHQTIASQESGDRRGVSKYPSNVTDITKLDLSDFSINNVPLNSLVTSDLITWFRSNLNWENGKIIGEPKFLLRAATSFQSAGNILGSPLLIRVPAEDYKIPFVDLINYLGGKAGLSGIKVEYQHPLLGNGFTDLPEIPASNPPLLPSFAGPAMDRIPYVDYNNVPTYRYYVAGPCDDCDVAAGVEGNAQVGNYWKASDHFPPTQNIEWKTMYLHQNGVANYVPPSSDEGSRMYIHDPDDPILTVGGANMIVRSPDGTRDSQSQMLLSDPSNAPYTMDREGVIQFNSEVIADSFTIVGFPVCSLYAKTNPGGVTNGPTDTDWNIRICDVWPDGSVYFVNEGIVNARARDYARALVDGEESEEDKLIPYSNINIGQIYEYVFKMWPIAYTWGKGHRIRILINSSNYTRYQVNPNLPLMDGDFFRRKPGDGQFYVYNGQVMYPRVAVQRVHFSPQYPTSITFPTLNKDFFVDIEPVEVTTNFDINVFPNPASDDVQIFVNRPSEYELMVSSITGTVVAKTSFEDNVILNVSNFSKGLYIATVRDLRTNEIISRKFTVQ